MKFLIISHVEHKKENSHIYGYGPYVKEMNLWLKYVDEVKIIAPMQHDIAPDKIDLAYEHQKLSFVEVSSFNLVTTKDKVLTLFKTPLIFLAILRGMFWADHIHLRCPGNMGLLGAIAQILFPWKIKTAKYAGNWDPKSHQPRSYNMQKWILSNTFVSKNMKVLAYGKWPNQSKNIIDFFTASYHEKEKEEVAPRLLNQEIKLLFVGTLNSGKRPMIAIETAHALVQQNISVHLDVLGEGNERSVLEAYISKHKLGKVVTLHGNQNSDFVKEKFKSAHFLILMSKSEGWPKVVAEAMFWGTVPLTSNVSCVNYMIGEGARGTLVEPSASAVATAIHTYLDNTEEYYKTSADAMFWSRQFTLESFENAIKDMLNG